MTMNDNETCPHCNRQFAGGVPNRTQQILVEHRTHLQSKALAAGGYVEAVFGSYGCESGCEYTTYTVYDAKDNEVATEGGFGDPDPDKLREMADYYGVRIEP